MHDEPPAALTDLLARLRLAKPEQVRSVRSLARALARGLPLFESVWVDALVQARLLTPYQATEINAGRGEQLQVGPYVIQSACGDRLGYAESFIAAPVDSKRSVHLLVKRGAESRGDEPASALKSLTEKFAALTTGPLPPPPPKMRRQKQAKHLSLFSAIQAAGADNHTLWAAFTPTTGVPASQWISWHGRLAPIVVLEIARQMTAGLATLEAAGIAHGEISATSLVLADNGEIQLAHCAVRTIFRPDETLSPERLPIEAFDYLAPEALSSQACFAPPVSRDLYACGCLWWHLLTGRSPLAGGDHAAKLQAVQAGKIPDVRRLAPDVPKILADLIQRCTLRDPAGRPDSFAEVSQHLGPSSSAGRRSLADVLARGGRRTTQVNWSWRARAGLKRAATQFVAIAACLALVAAATWPLWRTRHSPADHAVAARSAAANPAATARVTKLVASPASDPAVRPANYQPPDSPHAATTEHDSAEASKALSPATAKSAERPIIELEADKEIPGAALRLQPGAIVRGKGNQRPRVVTPSGGLAVTADNVRFENIDFLWRQRPETIASPDRQSLIEVRASHAEFVGCTFQAVAGAAQESPPAIRLVGSAARGKLAPAGQVRLQRCALSGVACGVDCALAAPVAVEICNTLHMASGSVVRFSQPRTSDAPASVTLEHVTTRGGSSVIEINPPDAADELAPLTIHATGCVLAPESGGLLSFTCRKTSAPISGKLRAIEWLGSGSLTLPDTAVAIWRHGDASEPLPEDEVSVDGLVASAVEFVGAATNDPASSRLKKWVAPVQSEEPPGIGDDVPTIPSSEPAIASAAATKQK